MIALHKGIVTVRQMFSDGPATKSQAAFRNFGDVPFSIRRLPDLAGTVLMKTAPLSERFNFEGIVSLCAGAVNRISFTFLEFCTTCRRKNI